MVSSGGGVSSNTEFDDSEKRTTAHGIWRYGLEYVSSARILAIAEAKLGKTEDMHWDATYQCVCQGLELAFKAYVRSRGATLNDLRRIGHSINKASERAFELGLDRLAIDHLAAIDIADRLYSNHEFRYIQTGAKSYPPLHKLIEACVFMLLAAARSVSIATTGDERNVARMRQEVLSIATLGERL